MTRFPPDVGFDPPPVCPAAQFDALRRMLAAVLLAAALAVVASLGASRQADAGRERIGPLPAAPFALPPRACPGVCA